MSRSRATTLLLAALLLVGGANLGAYAATGKPLLLGKANDTPKTTVLERTKPGPALEIKVRPDSPPLKVSSKQKVAKLNADSVDGLDGKALRTTSTMWSLPPFPTSNGVQFTLSGIKPGAYQFGASFSFTGSGSVGCELQSESLDTVGSYYGPVSGGRSDIVMAGYVDVPSGPLRIACFSGSDIAIVTSYQPRFVLTRLDVVTAKNGSQTTVF